LSFGSGLLLVTPLLIWFLITLTSFSCRFVVLPFIRYCVHSSLICFALLCLFGPTPGRKWRIRAHRTLANAYHVRVVGAREDNIEHIIHHLTKALENVAIEEPGSTTEGFGKGPSEGLALTWSEILIELCPLYSERVKVSYS
jgi:hypothetical protein